MIDQSKKLIREKLTKLPKEIQDVLTVSDWERISEEIGKKYLFSNEEINILQIEIFIILGGMDIYENFAWNIERELGISKKESEEISEEVAQKIFTPIYKLLAKKIKEGEKYKNPNWQQTLSFILSGGDYSVFLEKNSDNNITEESNAPLLGNNSKINDF